MVELSKLTWHNFPALALESTALRVVIVPEIGAKIVSLWDKIHHHEWLVPPMRPVKPTLYGADFVSQDMSGWDEMLPTISACTYAGIALPDHGEVWSIPWQVEENAPEIITSVSGVALPYRLARSAALVSDTCLKLSYMLTSTGEKAFPYLWAAHPQFAASPQTRILLPAGVTQVVNVMDDHPDWGKSGEQYPWPQARALNGQMWKLDRVSPAETNSCRKFYIPPDRPIAWAALLDERLGYGLRLEWQPNELPYFGLWVDQGTYNSRPVAALEPSSGYYDSLQRSIANEMTPVLMPGTQKHWDLFVQVNTHPIGID